MLEPEKISLNGNEYMIGRLDLFKAMNVSRLVAPILPMIFNNLVGEIARVISESKDDATASIEDKLNEVGFLITTCSPILASIAAMPEKDFKEVIATCLGCIERKVDNGYTKLMQNGVIAFADVDQGTALLLVFRVLARELRPIFAALNV